MSEKPQDEQLSGKVVCSVDGWPKASLADRQRAEVEAGTGRDTSWQRELCWASLGYQHPDPRTAQPQAPARRHDGECADEKRGLYGKYIIQRADGSDAPGGKHAGCQYFVLDLTHDNYALPALREYARWCRGQFPLLADDLDALRTGNKAFDLTAQAPAPSLDARDLHQKALRAALDCLNAHEHWQDRVERARCVIEKALAAPTAPKEPQR